MTTATQLLTAPRAGGAPSCCRRCWRAALAWRVPRAAAAGRRCTRRLHTAARALCRRCWRLARTRALRMRTERRRWKSPRRARRRARCWKPRLRYALDGAVNYGPPLSRMEPPCPAPSSLHSFLPARHASAPRLSAARRAATDWPTRHRRRGPIGRRPAILIIQAEDEQQHVTTFCMATASSMSPHSVWPTHA